MVKAIKFAAQTWAEEEQNKRCAQVIRIFGSENGDLAHGGVIFFDACPSNWPSLEVDILNPHYKDYYEGTQPPADWLSPEPVYFLTVKPGQPFLFAVGAKPENPGSESHGRIGSLVDRAWETVLGAVQDLGLGGKTAVGYGYFE